MIPLQPSRAEFARLATPGINVIPVWTEIVADGETPVSAFAKLGSCAPSFLLESAEQNDQVGRYSFLGAGALALISARDGEVTLTEDGQSRTFRAETDPFAELEKLMASYKVAGGRDLPGFHGGAVGYLSYDTVRWFEPTVPPHPRDELGVPDMFFMIAGRVVIFDHKRRRIKIVANAFLKDGDLDAAYDHAAAQIAETLDQLSRPIVMPPVFTGANPPVPETRSNTSQAEYHAMVERAQEYIRAGDIFQMVPAQRFETDFSKDALDLYRALRFINPSPYMFCIRCPDGQALVGSSPEVHVRLTDGLVEIRPIAGTRKRGVTPEEDQANAEDLLADPKERAEHLMLVDLARNDVAGSPSLEVLKSATS